MGKLILDEALRAKLGQVNGEVELCDASGQRVGYFLSPDAYMKLLYARAKAEITDEELEEAREEYRKHGGVTTAQLLAHLKSLDEERNSTS
jgi:hypothetical protein